MAGETGGLPANQLSELIQYAAAFLVAVIVGLATRFGWTHAKDIKPESHVEVVASAVDNRAVKALVDSIDNAVDRLAEIHEDNSRREKRQTEIIGELADDVRRLIKCLHSIAEKGRI